MHEADLPMGHVVLHDASVEIPESWAPLNVVGTQVLTFGPSAAQTLGPALRRLESHDAVLLVVPPGTNADREFFSAVQNGLSTADLAARGWCEVPDHESGAVLMLAAACANRDANLHAGRGAHWESWLRAVEADHRAASTQTVELAQPRQSMLEPLHLASSERSGTTGTMNLLRSSNLVVSDGEYPFEDSYAAYLEKLSLIAMFDNLGSGFIWNDIHNPKKHLIGPPPTRSTLVDNIDLATELMRTSWQVFSKLVRKNHPNSVYYADKRFVKWGNAGGVLTPRRKIIQVRDPRDVVLSIAAGMRKGLWGGPKEPPPIDEFFTSDAPATLDAWGMQDPIETDPGELALLVRYEDLVGPNRTHELRRLEHWLGVQFSLDDLEESQHRDRHSTTERGQSAARWRRELSTEENAVAAAEYASYLTHFGYDLA